MRKVGRLLPSASLLQDQERVPSIQLFFVYLCSQRYDPVLGRQLLSQENNFVSAYVSLYTSFIQEFQSINETALTADDLCEFMVPIATASKCLKDCSVINQLTFSSFPTFHRTDNFAHARPSWYSQRCRDQGQKTAPFQGISTYSTQNS